jgi:SAM-dependent methyltransferase
MNTSEHAKSANAHYDSSYFDWQQQVGIFGGIANLIKFQDYIRPIDMVVDFGAGGGFLLSQVRCAEKIGVEINAAARSSAEGRGLKMLPELENVPDDYADVIISNHALEHTDYPLSHLRLALKKLKPGGLAVFVVPCEQAAYRWAPNDINFHIYSWGPMSFGNLFVRAGFEVVESKAFFHKWPPHFPRIQRLVGWPMFHRICRVFAHFSRDTVQIRCVARRPMQA